jgi:hypothetical protein
LDENSIPSSYLLGGFAPWRELPVFGSGIFPRKNAKAQSAQSAQRRQRVTDSA